MTNFAFSTNGSGVKLSPFYECIAVSKTGDPVAGGWYFYTLRTDTGDLGWPSVGAFADYPKFGVWINCLYMTANLFDPTAPEATAFLGTMFASLSLSDMESGAVLTWAVGTLDKTTFTVIPSNLSGTPSAQLPAAGTPNYLVSESRTTNAFEVRKFTPGTNCGGGGSLTAATNVSQTSYTVAGENIVPQPNTTTLIDSGGDGLRQKVQYRKVGTAESLWVVHSVRTSSSSTVRPQWAQLNVTGGTISTVPVQQQIYAPDATLNRWMGSIAADRQGNVALGYSTSNGTSPNFPSIAYSGRLAGDPLNSLPQTEVQLIAGAGSQTTCGFPIGPCNRWGDYTSMSIDPSDNCTFWYTNQYYDNQTNASNADWRTRIASFKFPSCGDTVKPTLPANLTASAVSSTSIGLHWTDSTGETSYDIYRWTGAWTLIGHAAQNATGFTDTGLTPATTYYHYICATNGAGSTCNTAYTTATTLSGVTKPTLPANLTASAVSSTSIGLHWTDSTGETSYDIYRWTGAWTLIGHAAQNATGFTDTGPTPATTYYHYICATNGAGSTCNTAYHNGHDHAERYQADPARQPDRQRGVIDVDRPALTDSTGETSYDIYRWTGAWTLIGHAAQNATGFTDTGSPRPPPTTTTSAPPTAPVRPATRPTQRPRP